MYQEGLKAIAQGSQPEPHASLAALLKDTRAQVDTHLLYPLNVFLLSSLLFCFVFFLGWCSCPCHCGCCMV
jgi:hypothetical protein